MLLPLPAKPTQSSPLLVQSESVPVTSTLLSEDVEAFPMKPAVFATVPPLATFIVLPLPP